MAKKSAGTSGNKQSKRSDNSESVAGYFRKVFAEHPALLGERSNDRLLQQWLKDHPNETEVPSSVRANLANLKSVLRSKKRAKVAARAEGDQTIDKNMKAKVATKPTGSSKLEALEHQIDECLMQAKTLDREGLERVIHHLRHARNEVVWKIGQ